MNLSLPRLALVASFLATLVTGMPTAFAHDGHHTATLTTGATIDAAYLPYLGGFGDPLGLTASNPANLDFEVTGSIAEDADYIPYLGGVGDPLGLTSSR